jgi:type IV pilus assembly protein PilA
MFQRFHAAREQREGGFTLIELLVVILIIAILAAIAIPVFLRQREKGWRSQVESALKNAATAEESYLTANGTYTTSESTLATAEGFKKAADVNIDTITIATGSKYCIQASHDNLGAVTAAISSDDNKPTWDASGDTCAAGGVKA